MNLPSSLGAAELHREGSLLSLSRLTNTVRPILLRVRLYARKLVYGTSIHEGFFRFGPIEYSSSFPFPEFIEYIRVGFLSTQIVLELIQNQMAQKPMLRAEAGMRVHCANKAIAECFRRERGIGQIPRKICNAHSAAQSRGRCASKEARDMRNTRSNRQRSKCAFQRARRLLFCP